MTRLIYRFKFLVLGIFLAWHPALVYGYCKPNASKVQLFTVFACTEMERFGSLAGFAEEVGEFPLAGGFLLTPPNYDEEPDPYREPGLTHFVISSGSCVDYKKGEIQLVYIKKLCCDTVPRTGPCKAGGWLVSQPSEAESMLLSESLSWLKRILSMHPNKTLERTDE